MKYTIEEYLLNEYNASSKARKDISHFVLQNGFRSIFKFDKTKVHRHKMAKLLLALILCAKIFMLKKDDVLFVQTSLTVLRTILRIKAFRGFKLIYLVHDLYCLKYNTAESRRIHAEEISKDVSVLSQCDFVIVHNERMAKGLEGHGCKSRLIPLEIFDYACHLPEKVRTWDIGGKAGVVFAGYLGKADFLRELDKISHESFSMIIYGIPEMAVKNSIYKGCVDADVLPAVIEGHFGLIWEDGYRASPTDNYMCINNPHKLSMYIVAGLPVIAWTGSAVALFVETNNIGITVDSLDELDGRIKSVSPESYSVMVNNCLAIRRKLVRGGYLCEALKKVQAFQREVIQAK